jgi:hypothetical protein
MDLTEFLTARLDEDEAVAKRNIGTGPGWVRGLGDSEDTGPNWPDYQTFDGDEITAANAYLDCFRPRRMLREIEAGRKFLAWYADSVDAAELFRAKLGTGTHMATAAESYLNAIRARAAVYSDHPDYDPLWAPPE